MQTFLYALSPVKDVFSNSITVIKKKKSSLSHLVSTVGSPCDSDGAFVACLYDALAGLHTEALLLQGRHVIPQKLTTLEKNRHSR